MNEQRIPASIRINNAIDLDAMDAKTTLNLIERFTELSNHPETFAFSDKELQTVIRNCVHAIILNLTKTIEKPREGTYNLQSLIHHICSDEDQDMLKKELHEIRGNKIYGKLVEYRNKIVAHRNMEYGNYQVIEQEFTECGDYLIQNKKRIEKLIGKIYDLQMKIKRSRDKKLGLPTDSGSDFFIFEVIVSKT